MGVEGKRKKNSLDFVGKAVHTEDGRGYRI